MNFYQATDYLDSLSMFGIKLGLEQVKNLFELAELKWEKLRFIHLVGTNGKGSCGAMLQSALREAGCKVGFYSSPHLVSIRERFRINGKAISEEEFAATITKISGAVEKLKQQGGLATYFEVTTAVALAWFLANKVDFVVWECGMGGRLDATNVVTPEATVITNIGLDHTKYLGDTLAKIAYEKAGAIKSKVPVFVGEMSEEALNVITAKAKELDAEICMAKEPDSLSWQLIKTEQEQWHQECVYGKAQVTLPLTGIMQRQNFMLTVEVLQYICQKFELDLGHALNGIGKTRWPGRIEQVSKDLWIDGGHNSDGVASCVNTLKNLHKDEKFCVIFGAFKDKAVEEELLKLEGIANEFVFVLIQDEFRASYSGEELVMMVNDKASRVGSTAVEEVEKSLKAGKKVLVTGSLYLVAEVLAEYKEPDAVLNI